MDIKKLPLKIEDKNICFFYRNKKLEDIIEEIENFILSESQIFGPDFVRDALFPYEIKNNNGIEGYDENLEEIINILNIPNLIHTNIDLEKRRVINLKKGYEYILKNKEINEDNLKELYNILSYKILEDEEIIEQG